MILIKTNPRKTIQEGKSENRKQTENSNNELVLCGVCDKPFSVT